MHMRTACQALRAGKTLELRYGGHARLVEVHVCGWTKYGFPIMRAWQISGGSQSGERCEGFPCKFCETTGSSARQRNSYF